MPSPPPRIVIGIRTRRTLTEAFVLVPRTRKEYAKGRNTLRIRFFFYIFPSFRLLCPDAVVGCPSSKSADLPILATFLAGRTPGSTGQVMTLHWPVGMTDKKSMLHADRHTPWPAPWNTHMWSNSSALPNRWGMNISRRW